jgi:hypothetical protein
MAATRAILDDPLFDIPDNGVWRLVGERREAELAITYWEQQAIRLGYPPTLTTFNNAEMSSEKWAYRFILSVDPIGSRKRASEGRPIAENWVFLFCGEKLAALLNLPKSRNISVIQQLPARFLPVFTKGCYDAISLGCYDAISLGVPIRMQGAVEGEDGRQELYRAVFIGLRVRPHGPMHLVFGAFNCRVKHSQA